MLQKTCQKFLSPSRLLLTTWRTELKLSTLKKGAPLLFSVALKSSLLEPNHNSKEVNLLGLDVQNKVVYISVAHIFRRSAKM